LGATGALTLSALLHAVTAAALAAVGWWGALGVLYWIGYGVFVAMLVYQHSVVRPNDLSRVNVAFFTANGVASVIFASFAMVDLWRSLDGSGISN
jgi:4-hydroxybenzoate polyprenyltransferase